MEKIHFTPKDILRKEFKQKMRGYDPTDVDSFLDMVIRDYEVFNKTIQDLRSENDQLRSQIDNQGGVPTGTAPLSSDETGVPPKNDASFKSRVTRQISDLSNRVANLENRVYGPQSDPDSHRL